MCSLNHEAYIKQLAYLKFGVGTLSKGTIRDDAILLNEGWLFVYAKEIRKAREFMKTKKLSFLEEESQNDPERVTKARD